MPSAPDFHRATRTKIPENLSPAARVILEKFKRKIEEILRKHATHGRETVFKFDFYPTIEHHRASIDGLPKEEIGGKFRHPSPKQKNEIIDEVFDTIRTLLGFEHAELIRPEEKTDRHIIKITLPASGDGQASRIQSMSEQVIESLKKGASFLGINMPIVHKPPKEDR